MHCVSRIWTSLAWLNQFSLLLQLPQNMTLASKVVKVDWKIIISLRYVVYIRDTCSTFGLRQTLRKPIYIQIHSHNLDPVGK